LTIINKTTNTCGTFKKSRLVRAIEREVGPNEDLYETKKADKKQKKEEP